MLILGTIKYIHAFTYILIQQKKTLYSNEGENKFSFIKWRLPYSLMAEYWHVLMMRCLSFSPFLLLSAISTAFNSDYTQE